MKTAILIKENRTQLILEPESRHDNEVLKILSKLPNTHYDDFYDCEGGWTRRHIVDEYNEGKDLIIVFDKEQKK